MVTERCRQCEYAARLDSHNTFNKTIFCNYIGRTGTARMFVCESGDACTLFKRPAREYHGRPKRPVVQYDMDGNEIAQYEGISIAGKHLKIDPSSIRKCALGVTKHAGGFQWKYADMVANTQED